MIFNSLNFFIFFTVVFVVYYLTPAKYRWLCILLASTFFYAYAKPIFLFVPLLITVISYFAGIEIEKADLELRKKKLFIVSVTLFVSVLVFFKYANFFTSAFTDLFNFISKNNLKNNFLVDIAAPLGISYINFQAIGYLIEIKRGNEKAERNFGYFATYLLFFPKIIAGPVERAHNFLPQLKTPKRFIYENFVSGARQMLWGLFKKIVIADRLSIYVNAVYNHYEHHSGISLLFASICYALQLYADFSGYTDMALGFSRMLGFELIPNFNRPLFAKSVTEFWRKWHISLSTWFADYFYSPIAVEKRDWGIWGVIYACFLTFTVLGFWHGANWTFIIFGALQGFILALEIITRKQRKNIRKKIPKWLNDSVGVLFTFGYFVFSEIFFRADTITQAGEIIKKIFTFKGPLFLDNTSTMMFIFFGICYLIIYELKKEFFDNKFTLAGNKYWIIRNGYYCLLIFIVVLTGVFDGGEFIYFQF